MSVPNCATEGGDLESRGIIQQNAFAGGCGALVKFLPRRQDFAMVIELTPKADEDYKYGSRTICPGIRIRGQ